MTGESSALPEVTVVAHNVGTPGGMESQLGRLVGGLIDRGHRVTVVSCTCELAPHPRLRWVRVPIPKRPFSLAYPLFLLLGSLAVRLKGRGVVHTTGALVLNRAHVSTVHFCHAAFRERTGLVQSERQSPLYRLNGWISSVMSEAAERLCYRVGWTPQLVAVSHGVGRELAKHFGRNGRTVAVIPNGVEHAAFASDPATRVRVRSELGLSDHELVAVFVGGDWGRKGLEHAIEAVARSPRWHLIVVGGGDAQSHARLAALAGAEHRVHFVGRTSEPAPYYAAADAFVLPTAYETFSLVTFEAAASGLPLLVTRVSGVEDLLEDGENGWFIERDSGDVARRLTDLEDPSVRQRMGHAAREASRRYDWESVVAAYGDLYSRLQGAGRN